MLKFWNLFPNCLIYKSWPDFSPSQWLLCMLNFSKLFPNYIHSESILRTLKYFYYYLEILQFTKTLLSLHNISKHIIPYFKSFRNILHNFSVKCIQSHLFLDVILFSKQMLPQWINATNFRFLLNSLIWNFLKLN